MKTVVTTRFRPGTAIQRVIHATVNAAPIPKTMKLRLKNCPGCNRRAAALDRRSKILISRLTNNIPKHAIATHTPVS